MRMILLLIHSLLHRPVARYRRSGRPDHWIEIGARAGLKTVFGEEPAAQFNPQLVIEAGDLYARLLAGGFLRGCLASPSECQGEG